MTKINVCLLQPPGFIHAFALLEAAEYIAHKAKLLGYDVSLAKNRLVSSSLNIVFGAHINPSQREPYPTGTVIFNTEQLSSNSVWITNGYKNILDKYFVWDYSQDNLNQISHQNKALVNFYHVDELQRIICHENKKYDLLFYGSMNDRRKAILDNISKKGISIHFVSALYGPERDLLLGECRAVLNLHFYDSQIFQQIRAFYPLINNIPVISENFPLTSAPSIFHDAVFTPGGEEFEKFVAQLLKDNSNFEELSKVKIENFYSTVNNDEFDYVLQNTLNFLNKFFSRSDTQNRFEKMNLGSGKDYRHGYLNVDLRHEVLPDIVFDFSQKFVLPIQCESHLYGLVAVEEGQFSEIIANDVLEHVHNLEMLMGNCLKLLKVGGKLIINVPYDLSFGAWQDPTHIRGFNQNSWLYYTDWFWYFGWFSHRFDLTELTYTPSAFGQELINKKNPEKIVLTTPRSIDSMTVVLTKRETTPEEKTMARSFSNNIALN